MRRVQWVLVLQLLLRLIAPSVVIESNAFVMLSVAFHQSFFDLFKAPSKLLFIPENTTPGLFGRTKNLQPTGVQY